MSESEQKYELFNLTDDLVKHLRQLADPHFPLSNLSGRVVVDTVIVKDGVRKLINTEERGAKLV